MKKQRLNQLHISHYIKEPQNLKLLILAGTEVQKSEFQTIRRCINLIKLDLSNNGLKHIPIPLQQFSSLKIIYLHDNSFQSFQSINIKGCSVEYITLFNNPIKNYRRYLLNHLKSLKGIDRNIVSTRESNSYEEMKVFLPVTEMKWPLVEVDKELENQNDYLNLLKGELLILNDGYFKTYNVEKIELYFRAVVEREAIQAQLMLIQNITRRKSNLVQNAARKWRDYTDKRRQLRQYLVKREKEHLIANRIEYRRYLMSDQANRVISNYTEYIRKLTNAKKLLRRGIVEYDRRIKVIKEREQKEQPPFIFYVKESQWDILNKVFLYIKKLLFNNKQYQLCEDFEEVVKRTGKKYLIIRARENPKRASVLMEKVAQMMNTTLVEDYTQKRCTLYNRKGHIQILNIPCPQTQFSEDQHLRMMVVDQKLESLYRRYDTLSEWRTNNPQIYYLMNKLVRFYNAGNTSRILKNTTAYFQTQIPEWESQKVTHSKIYTFQPPVILRAVSAAKIQCFWRKVQSRARVNCINIINESRASKRIQRWYRSLKFLHRNRFIQEFNFYERTLSQSTYYLQLFIYMQLPCITNTLDFNMHSLSKFVPYNLKEYSDLYQLIHKNTKIKTMSFNDQSWVRIDFSSVAEAIKRLKLIRIFSYRLPHSTSIKLFKLEECIEDNSQYEETVSRVFSINIDTRYVKTKSKPVDNPNAIFIFEKNTEQPLQPQPLFNKARGVDVRISMFVVHQSKRALKLDTDLIIFCINNLYREITTPLFLPQEVKGKQPPRYSIPLLLQQLSNTKKLMPLKQIRPHKQRSERRVGHHSRHKSRSMMGSKEESMLSLGSLKLISETMPFKKR